MEHTLILQLIHALLAKLDVLHAQNKVFVRLVPKVSFYNKIVVSLVSPDALNVTRYQLNALFVKKENFYLLIILVQIPAMIQQLTLISAFLSVLNVNQTANPAQDQDKINA